MSGNWQEVRVKESIRSKTKRDSEFHIDTNQEEKATKKLVYSQYIATYRFTSINIVNNFNSWQYSWDLKIQIQREIINCKFKERLLTIA